MSDPELTRAAVAAAGLPARRFAWLVGRDERTVRRWLTGEMPVPAAARSWLERWLALSARERAQVTRALAG